MQGSKVKVGIMVGLEYRRSWFVKEDWWCFSISLSTWGRASKDRASVSLEEVQLVTIVCRSIFIRREGSREGVGEGVFNVVGARGVRIC